MDEMCQYISNLKLADVPVTQSPKKTGFLGFLISVTTLRQYYSKFVEKSELEGKEVDSEQLKYILTNKFSQDHLEHFFGAIRAKGGFNNYPSARHFEAAYKRLLIHTEVTGPESGNVSIKDLTILTCGSGHQVTMDDSGNDLKSSETYLDFEKKIMNDIATYKFYSSQAWNLTDYVEDVVGYISGYVVRSFLKCITCSQCTKVLEGDNVKYLQKRKKYRALTTPSDIILQICVAAEKYFRFFHKPRDIFNKHVPNLPAILIKNTMETI
ncbi:unnamed protein product [Acanthoscelides obtectus]|uniref:Transposable element P transposase-like RNase H C-terminal domain-containing protein n=1 Tax=Acanthoscelides obtectus TaxID=200917 RepID=A0A9P0QHF5_ACAOB|nr:unnamed protein product [Acanthoscelides obtectus]CAH2021651.1 unnamed protein product [Acanthoscelides obtectus]CAK1683441.1 DNA transposase THAP9 [Acanthoscelides obtectus]CAK1686274.1 DNA transposase THAP9 [Acanthoscelides obtectus]